MKLFILSVLALTLAGSANATFLPENNLKIPVGVKLNGGLSEAQFNAVIDKVEHLYAPVVASKGGRLNVNRKWTDATVNANATRLMGTWNVNMYGGLARHETITEDGFTLVLCHELGHHLGGAPKVSSIIPINKWASNEGEADYWAALKCMRNVFLHDNNQLAVKKLTVPETLATSCAKQHPNKDETAICIREGMAGDSVSKLFAALTHGAPAQFDTPDTKQVSKTNDAHPAYQCRLDTFFQGSLCDKAFTMDVSDTDETVGTCTTSNGDTLGIRPRCWFKPSK